MELPAINLRALSPLRVILSDLLQSAEFQMRKLKLKTDCAIDSRAGSHIFMVKSLFTRLLAIARKFLQRTAELNDLKFSNVSFLQFRPTF